MKLPNDLLSGGVTLLQLGTFSEIMQVNVDHLSS